MQVSRTSHSSSRAPQVRVSQAALHHLALLLLLTPLLGGLRILIGHVDQGTTNTSIAQREVETPRTEYVLVEVPRTEYVRVEVPVPTVIIVEVPARPAEPIDQVALASGSDTIMATSVGASGAAESGAGSANQQPSGLTMTAIDTTRTYRPGPSQLAFTTQQTDEQPTSDPGAEQPVVNEHENVIAEAPAPVATLSPNQQALAGFYAYTDQNWSAQGYSSADEMREALGNSTTGWLSKTSQAVNAEETTLAASASTGPIATGEASTGGEQVSKQSDEPTVVSEVVATEPAAASSASGETVSQAEPVAEVIDAATTAEDATVIDTTTAAAEPTALPAAESVSVDAQPIANPGRTLDSFYTFTEQNWSAQGYSSAEEMRRSLGAGWLDRARQSDQTGALGN